mmetsp:Transcript_25025/g.42625  ORF Transcript_25025/g.42625 Transcript_25025/m.42625 type:complete len:126 (+) Transcript_25025:982-1359(+)
MTLPGQSSRIIVVVRNHIFHPKKSLLIPFCNVARYTHRIDLPNRDPEEWPLVAAFLHPSHYNSNKPRINQNNVDMLLPWFHDLQAMFLIKQCDKVYSQMINTSKAYARNQNQLQRAFQVLRCLLI